MAVNANGQNTGSVTVFRNDGAGNLAQFGAPFSTFGQNSSWVGLVDVTGDTVPDVVVASFGKNNDTWMLEDLGPADRHSCCSSPAGVVQRSQQLGSFELRLSQVAEPAGEIDVVHKRGVVARPWQLREVPELRWPRTEAD